MNSTVLKTALLNSKELLEQYLKIKIVDLSTTKPVKKQTKKVSDEKTTEGATKLEWK